MPFPLGIFSPPFFQIFREILPLPSFLSRDLRKENGVGKEDLAGRNVFLKVALGCVRQLRLNATDSAIPLFKDPNKGLVGGWGYFVDFVAKQIKEFFFSK